MSGLISSARRRAPVPLPFTEVTMPLGASRAPMFMLGSVMSRTTEMRPEVDSTRPTRPLPTTTGIPTATPSSEPRLISTVSCTLDGAVFTTRAVTCSMSFTTSSLLRSSRAVSWRRASAACSTWP